MQSHTSDSPRSLVALAPRVYRAPRLTAALAPTLARRRAGSASLVSVVASSVVRACARTRPAAVLLVAALVVSACEKTRPAAAAPSWPAGTVVVMNGEPVSAEEVDQVGSQFALVEPTDSLIHLRRLALTNVILPRIAAATANPERRAEMRALAEKYRAALVAGDMPSGPLSGPMEKDHKGRLPDIGMEIWSFALQAELDTWSPVIETVGAFQIARVKKRRIGPTPGLSDFTVGVYDFPYVDGENRHKTVDEAIDRSRFTFVDESWREVMPTAWIYRMRGETP